MLLVVHLLNTDAWEHNYVSDNKKQLQNQKI